MVTGLYSEVGLCSGIFAGFTPMNHIHDMGLPWDFMLEVKQIPVAVLQSGLSFILTVAKIMVTSEFQ